MTIGEPGQQQARPQPQPSGVGRGAILHTDFWWSTLPNFENLNEALLSAIVQHQAEEPAPAAGSNAGCWRGHRDYQQWPVVRDYAIQKLRFIHQHYVGLGTSCAPLDAVPEDNFEFEFWTNINEPGSGNAIHSHAKWHWSGVYYVRGTGTGPIAFYSQPYLNQQVTLGLPFGQSFTVDPSDGLLLIFPSYLLHEVLPNPADGPRVSLAFNVKIHLDGKR